MALDFEHKVPENSHAWCGEPDCDFDVRGEWAHVEGFAHYQLNMHLVHVWTPDNLDRDKDDGEKDDADNG